MIKLKYNERGLLLKLLDRIANLKASIAKVEKIHPSKIKKSTLGMYVKEHDEFLSLKKDGALNPIWDELEKIIINAKIIIGSSIK